METIHKFYRDSYYGKYLDNRDKDNNQLTYENIEDLEEEHICFICKTKTRLFEYVSFKKICLNCIAKAEKHKAHKHCLICHHRIEEGSGCTFCGRDFEKAKQKYRDLGYTVNDDGKITGGLQ